jgi:Sulfotransferase domain
VLKVVGAGLPRTGTNSLKLALERLTGGRCYHMREVSETPGSAEIWKAAAEGQTPG